MKTKLAYWPWYTRIPCGVLVWLIIILPTVIFTFFWRVIADMFDPFLENLYDAWDILSASAACIAIGRERFNRLCDSP